MSLESVSIGRNIRFYRKACGLSQTELAEQINLSYQQIQKYEYGTSEISVPRLLRIAQALHVHISDLYVLLREEGAEDSPPYKSVPGTVLTRLTEEELKLVKRFRGLKGEAAKQMALEQLDLLKKVEGG